MQTSHIHMTTEHTALVCKSVIAGKEIQQKIILLILTASAAVFAVPPTASAYSFEAFKKIAPNIAVNAADDYGDMINVASLLNDVDEKLILSVMVVESEGKTTAKSHKGALGLMQLMPMTAKAMGASDPREPYQNILAGTKYLKELQRVYKFNLEESLVAYNMGPTRAKRWLTQYSPNDSLYVRKVMHLYGVLLEEERTRKVTSSTTEMIASGILTKPRLFTDASLPNSIPTTRRAQVVEED